MNTRPMSLLHRCQFRRTNDASTRCTRNTLLGHDYCYVHAAIEGRPSRSDAHNRRR